MTSEVYALISTVLIFIAAVIPIYFSIKLQNSFRVLMIVLSIFTLSHGTYHILDILNYEFIAKNIAEPLSYAVLVIFGLMYMRKKISRKVTV